MRGERADGGGGLGGVEGAGRSFDGGASVGEGDAGAAGADADVAWRAVALEDAGDNGVAFEGGAGGEAGEVEGGAFAEGDGDRVDAQVDGGGRGEGVGRGGLVFGERGEDVAQALGRGGCARWFRRV
ncbi:MAG: hypothetical protein ACFHWZ_07265 [Phycisphaerales bacterium]